MTLDDVTYLLSIALALLAWCRAYQRLSRTTLSAGVAATLPLLRD
jgi:hypothetical protein